MALLEFFLPCSLSTTMSSSNKVTDLTISDSDDDISGQESEAAKRRRQGEAARLEKERAERQARNQGEKRKLEEEKRRQEEEKRRRQEEKKILRKLEEQRQAEIERIRSKAQADAEQRQKHATYRDDNIKLIKRPPLPINQRKVLLQQESVEDQERQEKQAQDTRRAIVGGQNPCKRCYHLRTLCVPQRLS